MNLLEQWMNFLKTLGITSVSEEQRRRAQELAAAGVAPPGTPGSTTQPMGPPPAPAPGTAGTPSATQPGLPNYVNQGPASGNPDAEGLPTTTIVVPDEGPGAPGSANGPPGRRKADLPYPNPTTDLQRAQNELRIRQWALEDARGAKARLSPDATASEKKAAQDAENAAQAALNSQETQVRQYESDQRAAQTKPPAGTDMGYTLETITTNQGKRNVRVYWKADGNGGKVVDTSKGDHGVEDIGGAESAVDVATAQANLTRLQQQIANENDPLRKEQLRQQVERAQFDLEQARARAPLEQETARVTLARLQAQLDAETDPLKKEQLRLAVEQARQNLNKPTESTQDGYLVRVSPAGEVSRVDLLTPDQRRAQDEATAAKREADLRGTLPSDPFAALQQETARLQGRAQDKLAELQQRQARGELSADQASNLFQSWFQTNVQGPLAGLRAAAEEAQRKERQTVDERNRLEDIRVQQANQQRTQYAQQAGEAARSALVATFPNARSPEFAQAFGANVAAMSQRAQGRTAEERMNTPRGPGYQPAAFDPGRIAAVMPSPDQNAAAARDRALAANAPAAAVRAGYSAPALPTGPDIAGLLGSVPYQGPLSAAPLPATGLLPTPGREAVDLGSGLARTYYGPTGAVYGPDWRITP